MDATLIDVSTVVFAGAQVASSQLQDVDGDGDVDLVLKFTLRETDLVDRYREALAEDPSSNLQTLDIALEALTNEGKSVVSDVAVDVVMTGKSFKDLLKSI